MVYINKCIDVNTAWKKFLQIYEFFCKGSISFQEISYAGKPQVVSRYIFQIYDPVYLNAADREIIENCFSKSFFFFIISGNNEIKALSVRPRGHIRNTSFSS